MKTTCTTVKYCLEFLCSRLSVSNISILPYGSWYDFLCVLQEFLEARFRIPISSPID